MIKNIIKHLSPTWQMRMFGLMRVPVIGFVLPSVVSVNRDKSVIKIASGWRTSNHVGSMYLGTLCVGADLAAGILTMHHLQRTFGDKDDVASSLVFKDLEANFLKRAEGDILFTCNDGEKIEQSLLIMPPGGVRTNLPVEVVATNPVGDKVAEFKLTLSLKK